MLIFNPTTQEKDMNSRQSARRMKIVFPPEAENKIPPLRSSVRQAKLGRTYKLKGVCLMK
jgi:hypothetical protein